MSYCEIIVCMSCMTLPAQDPFSNYVGQKREFSVQKSPFSSGAECTKIARFSAVAAAIFTAPGKFARLFEAPAIQ